MTPTQIAVTGGIIAWNALMLWGIFAKYRDKRDAEVKQIKGDAETQRAHGRRYHEEHITEVEESVRRIVERLSKISFRELPFDRRGSYAVSVAFSAEMMGAMDFREDKGMIASHIANQVEAQIASGHFITSARDNEMEREMRQNRDRQHYTPMSDFPRGDQQPTKGGE